MTYEDEMVARGEQLKSQLKQLRQMKKLRMRLKRETDEMTAAILQEISDYNADCEWRGVPPIEVRI